MYLKSYVTLWVETPNGDTFGVHWPSAIGDIIYLIHQVITHDQMPEGSYEIMGGSSTLHVTTLSSLLVL